MRSGACSRLGFVIVSTKRPSASRFGTQASAAPRSNVAAAAKDASRRRRTKSASCAGCAARESGSSTPHW